MHRFIALATFAALWSCTPAHATDCPAGAPSCKVITLTPDEEKVLTGQNAILDTAQQGRPLDLSGFVAYFRNKIATAPAGIPVATAPAGTVPDAPPPRPPKEAPPKPAEHAPVPKPDPRK